MAKRLFATFGLTWATSTLSQTAADNSYMGLRSPAANELIDVLEVLLSGTATTGTIGAFALCRCQTNSSSETALAAPNSDGGEYPGISALVAANVAISFIASTTKPVLSTAITDGKLNLGQNTFGGIIRWNAAPTQQWQLLGNAAPGAVSALVNLVAGGGQSTTANAHIIYEPY
jgi:hypothetical protein